MPYVKSLVAENSILFICEHWLRPEEIHMVIESDFSPYWTQLKSSIDPLQPLSGRPYGGCGFICEKKPGIVYQPIKCESDRISGIEVIVQGKKTLAIFGVYMPFDDRRVYSLESYMETLSELQGYLDNESSLPCMVVGDFNAHLPQARVLTKNWHRRKPFSKRSALLYDFTKENGFYVGNFSYTQPVNFTYQNSNCSSYIDHVLLSERLHPHLVGCEIIDKSADNVSDHLPIKATLKIERLVSSDDGDTGGDSCPSFPKLHWDNPATRAHYKEVLTQKLASMTPTDIHQVRSFEQAARIVNSLHSSLVSCMHQAAERVAAAASESRGQRRTTKHWWTRDCTAARDRTRLFFHIWKSLGRPSSGTAYECYREARRNYRRACRGAINSKRKDFNRLLTELIKAKRPGQFWNLVRKTRSKATDQDAIAIKTLFEHFKAKFSTNDQQTPTEFIQQADNFVQLKAQDLAERDFSHIMISEQKMVRLIRRLRKGCSPGIDGVTAEHLFHAIETSVPFHLCLMLT